jgi:ankyrin repeat protein
MMVDYLLRHGAKLDGITKLPDLFNTPIHFAIERGKVDVIPTLVRHGADLNQVAGNGQPALFFALTRYRPEAGQAFATLLQLGANPNVQSEAAAEGSLSAKIPLKPFGMPLPTGRTAIMHAITESHVTCGNWTFAGAPSKIKPQAPTDCRDKGIPHIELLLAHGAKLDVTDANGLTALHYAARTDYAVEIAELLISKGADVNARDDAGRTPLDHATELGLQRMPPVLIRHGGKSARGLR